MKFEFVYRFELIQMESSKDEVVLHEDSQERPVKSEADQSTPREVKNRQKLERLDSAKDRLKQSSQMNQSENQDKENSKSKSVKSKTVSNLSNLSRRTPNSQLTRKSSTGKQRFQLSEEDQKIILNAHECVDKAKDFKRQNASIQVVRESTQLQSHEEPGYFSPNEIDAFLHAIQSVVDADITQKHNVMVAQSDAVMKLIKNQRQGECCRDFIKYLSNLKKNFTESTNSLEKLYGSTQRNYDRFEGLLKGNNEYGADKDRKIDLLQLQLKQKEKDVNQLRDQLQQLLNNVQSKEDNIKSNISSMASISKVEQPVKIAAQSDEEFETRRSQLMDLASSVENSLEDQKKQQTQDNIKETLRVFKKLRMQLNTVVEDNKDLQNKANDATFKLSVIDQQTTFLEEKLSKVTTANDEKLMTLRTQLVIYKEKAKNYKQKLTVQLEEFKKNTLEKERDSIFKEKTEFEKKITALEQEQKVSVKKIEELENLRTHYRKKLSAANKECEEKLNLKQQEIEELETAKLEVVGKHQEDIKNRRNRAENQEMKLKSDEKEALMKDLKISFLQNNQKKLMAQKIFVEKQLQKDLRDISANCTRLELELKKDEVIKTNIAVNRIQRLTNMMTTSYSYITQVVGFMVFDKENAYEQPEYINEEQVQDMIDNKTESQVVPQRDEIERSDLQSIKTAGQILTPKSIASLKSYDPKSVTMDRLLKHNHHDITAMLLWWIEEELFNKSGTPISNEFAQLQTLLRAKINDKVQDDLKNQFMIQMRMHFQNHIFKISNKVESLLKERNDLSQQVNSLEGEIDQIQAFAERQQLENQEPVPSQPFTRTQTPTNARVSAPLNDTNTQQNSEVSKQRLPTIVQDKSSTLVQDEYDVDLHGIASQHDAMKDRTERDHLVAENTALRDRIKEVRLYLNKKVNDLQETIEVARSSYDAEISRSKTQYGKDLGKLNRKFERDIERQKNKTKEAVEEERKGCIEEFKITLQKEQIKADKVIAKLEYTIEEEQTKMAILQNENRQLRGASSDLYEGGWGTFALSFENPLFVTLQSKVNELDRIRQDFDQYKNNLKQRKSKQQKNTITKFEESIKTCEAELIQIQQNLDTIQIQPIEKLRHFIEVGFQIGSLNFHHTDIYNEQTYDSMLRKYVFEFQKKWTASEFSQLIHKIKQQISDNFALFNEINPIYITLNFGRPANAFIEKAKNIEEFHLIDRKVAVVTGRMLAINFLKCDQPLDTMRIIAYDNKKGRTYSLDLYKEDLLMLVDGNQRLVEEENMPDLCQLIANSLTLIKREIKISKLKRNDMNECDELLNDHVLAVEHRLFFNELYRQNWDQRNKMIKAKHDKHLQGLLGDVSTSTDFDKAIVYEAFNEVYSEQFALVLKGGNCQADHFTIKLEKGAMSGHFKLNVKLDYSELEQTLYLLEQNASQRQGESHEFTSAIIKAPGDAKGYESLAYVVSMEKIYGRHDVIVVKVASIQRKFAEEMSEFEWEPTKGSVVGSTCHTEEVFYLVKKLGDPSVYSRVRDFEILNTEVRTKLFEQAFGYPQKQIDFGNVGLLGEGDRPVCEELPLSNSDQKKVHKQDQDGVAIKEKSDKPEIQAQIDAVAKHIKQPVNIQNDITNEIHILRKFAIIRLTNKQDLNATGQLSHENESAEDDEFTTQFASITFTSREKLLEQGVVIVHVLIPELQDAEVKAQVAVTDLIQIEELGDILGSRKDELSNRLVEHLIVQRSKDKFTGIHFDQDVDSMSEVLRAYRQKQFDEMMITTSTERIELEVPDPEVLKCTQQDLHRSPKVSHMTLISHRPFKFTCYFLSGLKNFQTDESDFDWQCLYIEAYHPTKDRTFTKVLTENDLLSIADTIRQTVQMENGGQEFKTETLFSPKMTNRELARLAQDLMYFDTKDETIDISLHTLKQRLQERKEIEQQFLETGGRYIWKVSETDPEQVHLKTCVNRMEIKKRLVANEQKDYSQSNIQIEINEITIESMKGMSKIQVDIHDIDERTLIYRTEVLSKQRMAGKKIHMERINFKQYCFNNDKMREPDNKDKAVKDGDSDDEEEKDSEFHELSKKGFVLSISENSLPHEFTFTLVEPCSNIFWQFQYRDNKLNQIEGRMERQAFVQTIKNSLEGGMLRNVTQNCLQVRTGFQTLRPQEAEVDINLLMSNQSLEEFCMADSSKGVATDTLVYGRTIQYSENGFAEMRLYFSPKFKKLLLQVATVDQQHLEQRLKDQEKAMEGEEVVLEMQESEKIHVLLLDQPQSCFRYVQGRLQQIPLIYTVEQVNHQSPNLQRDRIIRVSLSNIESESRTSPLIDLVITEPQLHEKMDNRIMPTLNPAKKELIGVIYADAVSCMVKMEDIQHEYVRCEGSAEQKHGVMVKMEEPVQENKVWKLVYRKVIPNRDAGTTYVINVLRQTLKQETENEVAQVKTAAEAMEEPIKVLSFESVTKKQETFMFKLANVMTPDEIKQYLQGEEEHADLFKSICNSRLKIRDLRNENQMDGPDAENRMFSNLNRKSYMLYFIDPIVATASLGEKEDDFKNNARKLLRKEFSMFDIRQGFHLPLIQADPTRQSIMQSPRREYSASGMDNVSNEVKISKSLICQLERNDLMYDVYQLSSLELTIQISVFSRKDFKKISAATVTRAELLVELEKDRKSHLLEGQNREKLARYLVENTFYDERRELIYFLRSSSSLNEEEVNAHVNNDGQLSNLTQSN